ncbi:MAG TPA: glycoside hydrolase family 3 N-terminal domain-containing protein [Oleiagrimonas sp.]|nr:glycoside hydrolase family 3 N-terminal domain-containing protein [Oleiagrimonas sp.]
MIMFASMAASAALMAAGAVTPATAPEPPSSLNGPAMHTFVDKLMQRMTLKEKVGQLTFLGRDHEGFDKLVRKGLVGGANGVVVNGKVAGKPGTDLADYLHHMQELAMQSRLKIPLLFAGDVTHGFRTIFPVQLAMAATWDPELVRRVEHASAEEATAVGVTWTFSPMVDISRDPRWGRVVEGAGEDPYLGSVMAAAQVKGFQGDDLAAPDTMMSTVKHFAGYGAVAAGRDYNPAFIPPRQFHDVYLPPYRAAVNAGAASVMPAFITLDGMPASGDRHLLTGILRKQWGFRGMTISDYDAIPQLKLQRVVADVAGAARDALDAGMEMDLHSGTYLAQLPELVREGEVPMKELNNAVRHVLEAKYRLGLFEDPFRYGADRARAKRVLAAPQHRKLAREAAIESMVLLKNNGVLPLQKHGHIAVLGPLADEQEALLGEMHALGKADEVISVLSGIRAAVGDKAQVSYVKGVSALGDDTSGIAAAVKAAQAADVAIVAVGGTPTLIGEGDSRSRLDLPGHQLQLIKAVQATGTPVVVVLLSGRPLAIPWLDAHVAAILDAWLPGNEGGPAVAALLFGDANPSGKLPMTFPRDVGQVPLYYAHQPNPRPLVDADHVAYTSHYTDVPNTPLYPFGYGLSYTRFDFGPVHLSSDTLTPEGTLQVRVKVTNTGKRRGAEVVQLYIHDLVASVSRPVRQLKGFKKIVLDPGQSREVTFTLTPADLAFHRADMSFGWEPGDFKVYVGGDSTATDVARFTLVAGSGGH